MGLHLVKSESFLNICMNETITLVLQARGLAAHSSTTGALDSALLSHYL